MKAVSAQVVSCCVYDNPQKLCSTCTALFYTKTGLLGQSVCSSFSTIELHGNPILFQAQRDYFGAHTYELMTNPGKHVHTNWTGLGGNVSATTYDA